MSTPAVAHPEYDHSDSESGTGGLHRPLYNLLQAAFGALRHHGRVTLAGTGTGYFPFLERSREPFPVIED